MSTQHRKHSRQASAYTGANRPSRRRRRKAQSASKVVAATHVSAVSVLAASSSSQHSSIDDSLRSVPIAEAVLERNPLHQVHIQAKQPEDTALAQPNHSHGVLKREQVHTVPSEIPLAHPGSTQRTRSHALRRLYRRSSTRRQAFPFAMRMVTTILLLILLALAGSGVVSAASQFLQLRTIAMDAVAHLHAIEALLPVSGNSASTFDTATLQAIRTNLVAAERDFSMLRVELDAPSGALGLVNTIPTAGRTISSASALVAAADEACLAGLDAVSAAQPIVDVLHSGLFASKATSSHTPLLTEEAFTGIEHDYADALTHLDSAVVYARQVNFASLPSVLLKPSERTLLEHTLTKWPSIRSTLLQGQAWLPVMPALLGLSKPEKLLLVMQDRTELRATGGFMGNYGVATIDHARLDPLALRNVYLLDYPYIARYASYPLPAQDWWWPFSNFALRDANLSPDFPTSAQLMLKAFIAEGGPKVQGVVAFTPVPVERALQVIGPVHVPGYPDVVSASNLENEIHAHQLGSNLPYLERKVFTAALAQVLLAKVRAMSSSQLIALVKAELPLFKTKDIQVYSTDKQVETLLKQQGIASTISSGSGDGVAPVDDNVGGNKINQAITVTYKDDVTLSPDGSATHSMTITYDFAKSSSTTIWGKPIYHAITRIYVPANARLLSSSGLTYRIWGSDLSWREMWAGGIVVRLGTSHTLHLAWTVPHAAIRGPNGKWSYQLDFQHQAGSRQMLDLTVHVAGSALPVLRYSGTLNQDRTFQMSY